MLAFILIFGGFVTVKSKFFQIRGFKKIWRETIGTLFSGKKSECSDKEISQFGAFCSTLAATMGTGNIVGVASAVAIGGAGAIFWMWVSAFIGMMIVFAENFYGTIYRKKDKNGEWSGGAVNYIVQGTGSKAVALIYAALCVAASFGMGNMVQTNSISSALMEEYSVDLIITGVVTSFLCGLAIIGGIKRISAVTKVIIPFISVIYISASLIIIFKNIVIIPDILGKIFSEAFGISAFGGGVSGIMIKKAISTGLKRGVFSNEAGLGTSAMIHASGSCKKPEVQGMWGIVEVFTDTIVCCTLTALVILCYTTNGGSCASEGPALVINAFRGGFGKYAGSFVCISISVFAFATLISWSHCGESAFRYIFKQKFQYVYKFLYCIAAAVGAVLELSTVWTMSDIFNGLMIIPNIIALIILCIKNPIDYFNYKK